MCIRDRAYLPFIQGKAKVAHQEHCDVVELLGPDRESSHLEYKATLRTHQDSGETFKPLEGASLKTIAAFMNGREGGTLLIGVADDGTIHGLDSDYATRSKQDQDPRDWFQQHLSNICLLYTSFTRMCPTPGSITTRPRSGTKSRSPGTSTPTPHPARWQRSTPRSSNWRSRSRTSSPR